MGDLLPMTPPSGRPAPAPERLWREALGRQLRAERSARGERIADVAGRAGVSPQYLSEVERGRKDPSSEILSALAGAVDLTVRELTRRAGVHLRPGPCSSPPDRLRGLARQPPREAEHGVDDAVVHGGLGGEDELPLGVAADLLRRPPGVPGEDALLQGRAPARRRPPR